MLPDVMDNMYLVGPMARLSIPGSQQWENNAIWNFCEMRKRKWKFQRKSAGVESPYVWFHTITEVFFMSYF